MWFPAEGEPISFTVEGGTATQVAPDGAIWSLVDGDLVRTTSSATQLDRLGLDDRALLTLVGNVPLVVDVSNLRARFGDGGWQQLDTDADPSEILAQVPGPPSACGWIGANDDLWCVSVDGIDETSSVVGLDLDGGDLLAVAGEAAAVVRRGPSSIVRFDWRIGEILEETASVSADADLAVSATVDLVWVDDVTGDFVWGVNPWGIQAIDKNAQGILVLGEDGDVVDSGEPGQGAAGADDSAAQRT